MDSSFSQPEHVASLALSLLQCDSFQPLLGFSSQFLKERYYALAPLRKSDQHFSLFQWQHDRSNELLLDWCADFAEPPKVNHHSVYYRVWDSETLQSCVVFSASNSTAVHMPTPASSFGSDDSLPLSRKSPQRVGVVILLHSGEFLGSPKIEHKWLYHNLVEVLDWDDFSRGWYPSVAEALDAFEHAAKGESQYQIKGISNAEESEYWASYDMKILSDDNGKGPDAGQRPASEEDDMTEDDYWKAYEATSSEW
ncbi:uncharacterized protein BJ171DRAFT_485724 [Polychytrium aggregatum]|uniref:uncharacterized protein n=1 Tax=Polychytrium aggregatum TaxID=110093 RepID=UPI0022FE65EB|nr:uncharacterized protein BJ171DRAFT_485724 [Polychytrium aggregatum]KAI9209203.1 hypothetical protein BJ171DRAFT_485724 [Polychytrium aggregatum]